MLKISRFTGGIASTHGYLIENPEGEGFVVDAPEGMDKWLQGRVTKVPILVLTHQHFDHVQSAAAIKRDFSAQIYAFAPFSRELTLEFLLGFVTGSSFQVEAYDVDHILKGTQEMVAGGVTWSLAHVPGHSMDSVTFYSECEKLLLGGDVLMAGGVGRCDFPGGSERTLLAGIKEHLLTLPDDTVVLAGHGPETTIGEERESNPYLAG